MFLQFILDYSIYTHRLGTTRTTYKLTVIGTDNLYIWTCSRSLIHWWCLFMSTLCVGKLLPWDMTRTSCYFHDHVENSIFCFYVISKEYASSRTSRPFIACLLYFVNVKPNQKITSTPFLPKSWHKIMCKRLKSFNLFVIFYHGNIIWLVSYVSNLFECNCFRCSPSCAWEVQRRSQPFNITRWWLLEDCEWTWVQPMVPWSKCGQSTWKPKKSCCMQVCRSRSCLKL